jgi:NADPH-dependent 2,4-dienoyl-CoA reductase/sulfur reductase-like enzyme
MFTLAGRTLGLLFLLGALGVRPGAAPQAADVLVYGATPGGFCAAIAAAREGASVLLLEPTDHVGGVNIGRTLLQRFQPDRAPDRARAL